MTLSVLLLLGGLTLLYFGAEWLVGGSSSLALRAGISPVVAGLTVVAYGTSMPELVVSVKATMVGQSGLAVGNIVGSNLFNVGVILGMAAVLVPLRVQSRLIRWDIPFMLALSLVFAAMLWTGTINRAMGGILVAILIVWTVLEIRAARKSSEQRLREGIEDLLPQPKGGIGKQVLLILGGGIALAVGARWLVDGGVGLARGLGISETLIGLTIVAAGTSAPELAATVVAAARKQVEIAVGNVVGSNLFNILSVAGIAALVHPLDATGISHTDILVMLLLSAVMLPLAWTDYILKRWEGMVLLGIYAAYFVWILLS